MYYLICLFKRLKKDRQKDKFRRDFILTEKTEMTEKAVQTVKVKKEAKGTKQQKIFRKAKIIFDKIQKEHAKGKPYSRTELQKMEDIKVKLWEEVESFAMYRARQRMNKYRLDSQAWVEVKLMLAAIFYEKLDCYDPKVSAPTTFFIRYFDQAISEYLHKNSQHMSQYDANNIAKVRQAKHYFEENGIAWDIPMIATRSGLSIKVAKQALQRAETSIQADIDSMLHLKSEAPEPDAVLFEKERREDIMRAITETLNEEERRLFFLKVNVDGKHQRAYREVMEILNRDRDETHQLTERDVKQAWSGIIARLNSNRTLQQYNRQMHGQSTSTPGISHSADTQIHFYSGTSASDDISDFFDDEE